MVWSVGLSNLVQIYTAQYPLKFDIVSLNVGNTWLKDNGTAFITVTGTYYLVVELGTCNTGGSNLEVRVNDKVVFIAKAPYPFFVGAAQSRGNAAVLQLKKGDKVIVTLPASPSLCLFSGYYPHTAFSGLLLYPH